MTSSFTDRVDEILFYLQVHCAVLPWSCSMMSDTNDVCKDTNESFFQKNDDTVATSFRPGKTPEPFWSNSFWRRTDITAYLEYYKADMEEMLANFNNNYDDLATAVLTTLGSEQVCIR